ncbi:GCN5-related protein N-acetyltransferase [Rubellimicrobium mesophilum DSM 19309]|uniref:GCN5-related protein N-acetyltransferase n=1 Tax=Rubellimicrobium mesophilum DSM 19309 TaxID=442562 RepID=A0A017HLS4_9RHOB|nr:GNAT family N-acetyltransferase [Rubellimicrobium mesophilum]EYD74729.1 GCN5-related protein N-acetyltransferase [Rubellimicrobium mesophilum DSM 19309]
MILTTPHLRLEPFEDSHFEGLLALNSDPVVMRFFKALASEEDIRVWIQEVQARWVRLGYAWWSFIDRETEMLVGAGCIQNLEKDETKPLEVGWRLRPEHWGKGLATEAGRAMLGFAFDELEAEEVFAVANPDNVASLRVMERLGMRPLGLQPFYGSMVATYVKARH